MWGLGFCRGMWLRLINPLKSMRMPNQKPKKPEGKDTSYEFIECALSEVKSKQDYYLFRNQQIRITQFFLPKNLTITVYGGHVLTAYDENVAYVSVLSRFCDISLIPSRDTGGFPIWVKFLRGSDSVMIHAPLNVKYKGILSQGIFKKIMTDKDLEFIDSYVRFIKLERHLACPLYFSKKQEKFLAIINRAIFNDDEAKIDIIKRVIQVVKNGSVYGEPKSKRCFQIIIDFFQANLRPPAAIEIEKIVHSSSKASPKKHVRRDLKDMGLAWIFQKNNNNKYRNRSKIAKK